MFEFMRNIFASEQPTLEKYNIVDPGAVGDKIRAITVAITPPTEEATSTSVSLFWSDSENKVYEKNFESLEEAQKIYDSIKTDLHEVAELTKEEKLDAAEGLVTALMERYDVHTDKLVDGNPPPVTTTMAEKEAYDSTVNLQTKSPQQLQMLIDNWMERMPEVTDKDVLALLRKRIQEAQSVLDKKVQEGRDSEKDAGRREVSYEKCRCGHMKFDHEVEDDGATKCDECDCKGFEKTASKKKAKVVMQNVFFDTPEEAAQYAEKFKKKDTGLGDKPPMAGDFEDDLPGGAGEDKAPLGEGEEEIGPPSLSHKDFEKDHAKEQKSLTKRIEKEVKDQVKSNLDQKIASNFGAKEDALLDAMRDMGRTWEEIREYFVKGLKYDEDSVVYYLDQRKGVDSPELVDDKLEAPKPPEDLVTPETHDSLVDELLDDKPAVPEVDEIEKKDIPMRDKEIANSLTTEIEKKAEDPLETIPDGRSGTPDDGFPPTEFADTSDDMTDNPDNPNEIGDAPQDEIPDNFQPGEHVYVMGDYEDGSKGYEGEFVSEYKSDGEDYVVVDVGMNEMKEVPRRFVKKASYKETLKKKAAPKCQTCEQDLSGEEYMVCTDCKEKAKKEKELVMARLIKAGVDKELASRTLNLIKADIEELNDEVGDVWNFETDDEDLFSQDLQQLVDLALAGDVTFQQNLSEIWDGEPWESIKKKLETEGSVWQVWWMDGVHKLMQMEKEQVESSKKTADPDPVTKPVTKPVHQPATDPVETPSEVPTKYKLRKINPKDTKNKEIELGNAKAQNAFESLSESQQTLDRIQAKIDKVNMKAVEDIKKIREDSKQLKEQKLFQAAVERMANLAEATKDGLLRVGERLFTFVKETKQVPNKVSDKEKLERLYAEIDIAREITDRMEQEANKVVKEVTTKELTDSPYRESSLNTEAGLMESLESLWDGLKSLLDMSQGMEQELSPVTSEEETGV